MSVGKKIGSDESVRWLSHLLALVSLAILSACATNELPPLEALDRKVDLERFMGDWYVIGFIPVTIPFFSEEGAHNGVESYRLTEEGDHYLAWWMDDLRETDRVLHNFMKTYDTHMEVHQ